MWVIFEKGFFAVGCVLGKILTVKCKKILDVRCISVSKILYSFRPERVVFLLNICHGSFFFLPNICYELLVSL